MKFIESGNLDELIGKEIAFIQVAQFAENITLATKDGDVLVITQDVDEFGERKETRILNELYAQRHIESDRYVARKLAELGIFDLKAYQAEEERKRLENVKKQKQAQDKRDWEEYQRLRKKFKLIQHTQVAEMRDSE